MRRCLILVLSAILDPWKSLLLKQQETWDKVDHDRTDTIFYIGRTKQEIPKTIVSDHDEGLYNIGRRTLDAFRHSLTLNGWDFVARVHSSCYVHKRRLMEMVDSLPPDNVFAGLATLGEKPFMWGGGHYLMSRDVVEAIVARRRRWDHNLMEDVAMSELTKEIGIPWTAGRSCSLNPNEEGGWTIICYNGKQESFSFTDFADVNKADQFFYRVKNDPDRSIDLRTMELLYEHLIP